MSFLKPKTKPVGTNVNNQLIKDTFTGAAQQGAGAQSVLAGALGVPGGDTAGADAGFRRFSEQGGFENVLERLTQGITGGQAARGLLRSGSTGTRLLEEGTALNQSFFNNFLQNLQGLGNLGLGAGGLLANAGQDTPVTKPSTAGVVASLVGKGLAIPGVGGAIKSIFSDRRLKEDIEKLDEFEDGLGIYRYRYLGKDQEQIGVMADEVERLRPWALGPVIAGYATVNYGRL